MNDKIVPLELDLNEFPKELLMEFIIYAHEKDLTFNQALVKILEDYINNHPNTQENQLKLPLE